MNASQAQIPTQKSALDWSIKYPLYLLLLCVVGCTAHAIHLPDMIEGHGFIAKILLVVPQQIWIIGAAILQIYFFVGVRSRTRSVSPSMANLWVGLIVYTVVDCILSLVDLYLENELTTAISLVAGFVVFFIYLAIAVRLRKSATKRFITLGKVMIWTLIIFVGILGILIAMMPDNFGELQSKTTELGPYIRIEESYSSSTIIYASVIVLLSVIFWGIIFGTMASVIDDVSGIESEPQPTNATEETIPTVTAAESPAETIAVEYIDTENKTAKRSLSVKTILLITAIIVACGVGFGFLAMSVNSNESSDVDETAFLEMTNNEGLFFINLDNPDLNVRLSRTDSSTKTIQIGFEDAHEYAVEDGSGTLQNGWIRTEERNTLPFDVNLKIISPNHLIMEHNGETNHLYSIDFLENQSQAVETKYFGELEVQIFEIDDRKLAYTNLYGYLTLVGDNTAHTTGWFPGSEEAQIASLKFEPNRVIVTYGGENNKIVYGDI